MKKRIGITMLCILMVASSLTGCIKQDPKKRLDSIIKKSAMNDSVDMTIAMEMAVEASGQKIDMPVEMDIKVKDATSDKLAMEMKINMELLGQKIDMGVYYQDGYYYMDASGQKMKYAMDIEEIKKQIEGNVNYQNLNSKMMKDVTMKKDGKNEVYNFTMNVDEIGNLLENYMSSLDGMVGSGVEYKFSNASGSMTADKSGKLLGYTMNFDMDMTLQGQNLKAKVKADTKINGMGKEVQWTTPDFADYEEIEAPTLGE